LARRLATGTWTVENFEAGAIAALPHWKETTRIVRGYCELLRLDPDPILWRIRSQLQALAERTSAAVSTTAPRAAPPSVYRPPAATPEPEDRARDPDRRRRLAFRTATALGGAVGVAAVLLAFAHMAPQPAYRAASLLPAPVEAPLRAGLDALTLYGAPRREGLRWVDVGDPQLRKADKLPTSAR
jgi:hypothetical protein